MGKHTALLLDTFGKLLREGSRGVSDHYQQQQAAPAPARGQKKHKPGCKPCEARAEVERHRQLVKQYR